MLWSSACNRMFEVEMLQYITIWRVFPFSLEECLEGEGSNSYCFLQLDNFG
jgi:hypothetical protein